MMNEALLRFTVVLFSGKLIFNGVQGHFYTSIKFENIMYTEFTKKKVFEQ